MKKIVITFFTILIVLIIDSLLIFTIINYDRVLNDASYLVNSRTEEIFNFLTKYDLPETGVMEVDVNYRGAHGENYPNSYTYNYEFKDKLYLEDEEFATISYDKEIIDFFKKLIKFKNININTCSTKKGNGELDLYCDNEYINNVLGTNFNNINAVIHTKGIIREFDYIEIYLDDYKITLIDDELIIEYKKNIVKINYLQSGYYININDLLKANIIIDDDYSCSIVLNDKVYYLEIKDNELFIKFNSIAAIYNSITISAKYQNVELKKDLEIKELKDNPIANYIANSDFNIWR